ncbi:MAG: DUF2281 domain-containing protein [Cyanobacteria bacterium P01_G01_bin.49]
MTTKEQIIQAIEEVPEPILTKILEFIKLVKYQEPSEELDVLLLSESALAKDWLTEEEEKAWQDL